MYPVGRTARITLITQDRAEQKLMFDGIKSKDDAVRKVHTRAMLTNFDAGMTAYGNLLFDNNKGLVKLSQADSFPTQPSRVVQVFFEGSDEAADVTWTQLTAIDDFRNTTEDSFSIQNVNNGITFRSYLNGEKVELYGVSGTEVKFPFELFAGGFQWLQTWLDDNKWWRIANGLAEAATAYAKEQAQNFYDVLTFAGYATQARVATPAGQMDGFYDILTINAAYVAMMEQLNTNSGYSAPAPQMFLVYNSLDPALANRAPAIVGTEYNTSVGSVRLNPNIRPLTTPNITGNGFWLVLPGRKTRTGIRMDMTGFEHFDIFTYSGARVFWGRYTHVRGDADQVRFIPLT